MANDIIRPTELPARANPVSTEVVPSDNGTEVGGITLEKLVSAGRPLANQTEAVAGENSKKAMTPLTTKQAIDSQVPSKISQAIADLDLGTAAKSDADDFATAAQGEKADSALQGLVPGDNVSIDASDPANPVISTPSVSYNPQSLDAVKSLQAQANIGPVKFDTVAGLLADTILSSAPASGRVAVTPGKQIEAQGHRYKVAASDAADYHVQMAGGPRLYVGREVGGVHSTAAFGVVGDNIADDTVALQRCMNAAGQYGIVIVDRAVKSIRVTDTITVPNALTIMSYCHSVSTVSPREDAPFIWLDNPAGGKPLLEVGVGGMQINDVWLMGLPPTIPFGSIPMTAGSEAIRSSGVVRSNNLAVMSFDTAINATGGYYHQHVAPNIRHCKMIFKNAGAYNFQVHLGKFTEFDKAFESTGGSGPVTFSQSSFERWTTSLCESASAGRQKINFNECYVENYPSIEVSAGLSTANGAYYSRAYGFVGGSSLSIRDCNVALKGVRRWVYNSGNNDKITVSDGNTYWLYAVGGGGQIENTEYIFLLTNNRVFRSNDMFTFVNPDGSVVDRANWTGTTQFKNGDGNLTGAWDWHGFDYVRKIGPLPASATGLKAGTMYNNAGTVSISP